MQRQNNLVILKDNNWLQKQRIAGKCVSDILSSISEVIKDKQPNLSLKDLEYIADKQIKLDGLNPIFKGYKGFPSSICLSVNKQIVHGIPSDYILKEGDVVKFDTGASLDGVIADAASTEIYGEAKDKSHIELVKVCKEALNQAIKSIKVGNKIGCIGYAIHKYVTSNSRFNIILNYGGHGLDINTPHAFPFIANKSRPNEGITIQEGMTFCIEPMLVIGDNKTTIEKDGWTVSCNGVTAHEEHTVFVHKDSVEIITK